MRKILLILSVLCSLSAMAQDVIVKRNGEELQCKILEVSKNEVKYKRWTNQDGPSFAEKKSDIFMIKYENGEKEVVAYESPVLETPVVAPDFSAAKSNDFTLADQNTSSNVYLKYTSHLNRQSGIYKWGHLQSYEQAQMLLSYDWNDYKKARKDERTGKALAIFGGTWFAGGFVGTAFRIAYGKQLDDCWRKHVFHDYKVSGYALMGGYVLGTSFITVGIIKAYRGHKNATQIVNKYNEEYENNSKKTSMSKPEFNIGSKGNNLAFTLTF